MSPHSAGFDRNDYPGDKLLPELHRTFAYSGYWLNNPPGENGNTWTGKRETLKRNGFGFMILYNGRLDAELKGKDAAALGRSDAAAAIVGAQREGFPPGAIVFLDQEEGGRLYAGAERLSIFLDSSDTSFAIQAWGLLQRDIGAGWLEQNQHRAGHSEP